MHVDGLARRDQRPATATPVYEFLFSANGRARALQAVRLRVQLNFLTKHTRLASDTVPVEQRSRISAVVAASRGDGGKSRACIEIYLYLVSGYARRAARSRIIIAFAIPGTRRVNYTRCEFFPRTPIAIALVYSAADNNLVLRTHYARILSANARPAPKPQIIVRAVHRRAFTRESIRIYIPIIIYDTRTKRTRTQIQKRKQRYDVL